MKITAVLFDLDGTIVFSHQADFAAYQKVFKEFGIHINFEEFLWGDSFWADGYFAETVGKTNEEIIRKYIKEQRQASFRFSP